MPQHSRCGCGYRLPEGKDICWNCESKQIEAEARRKQGQELLDDIDTTIVKIMERAGMEGELLEATLQGIPSWIRGRIPNDVAKSLIAGITPNNGFGLTGLHGIGKTMAMAAIVKAYLVHRVQDNALEMGNAILSARPPVYWCDWRVFTSWIRGNFDRVGIEVEKYIEIPLLVLDDLGAERQVKASYQEEFASEQLDLILHGRRLRKRPTLWTSNLSAEKMQERYGAGTHSRLVGSNPPARWIVGKDLRLIRDGEANGGPAA